MTNLYALIVGIEKYDLPSWNRSGPVAGAIEMAYWCNSIGMPYKNIHMFLSVNDQDAAWEKERKDQLGHFKKSGAKIVEDTSLDAIDTFWRSTLPTLSSVDSKLLVYWCGHGVTRPDRDRILLHTNYRPDNLSSRVTSADNLVASLATQTYRRFKEQLIVADVCGDFSSYSVSPNTHPPVKPVDSITQHCYFATVDGQSTQIQNGIGQFTQSTLEVLKKYSDWPDLDDLKERMDETFRNGSLKPFKISIRTPLEEYEISNNNSAKANDASLQPSSEDVRQLISRCNEYIKQNELDELFQLLEGFLETAKAKVFDQERNSLQILQSDLTSFRLGELNGTHMPDTATQRRILITKVQKLLELIESKVAKRTNRPSNLKPSSFSSGESFSSDVIGKNPKEIASKGNQIRSVDSNNYSTGTGVVTSIEFTLDRPLGEFDESAFKSAFRQCTGIDAKMIRIASIRSGSTIVRVEGDSNVLRQLLDEFLESREVLHQFAEATGLKSFKWSIDHKVYNVEVTDTTKSAILSSTPEVVKVDELIDVCEQAFINDLWDDLFDKIDRFIPMLSSVGTRYRNELVVFRRDFKDNRASWRIKSINDEDYKVAKTSLWIRVREMLYSVREDLKVSQSKKNANEISIPSNDKDASKVTSDSEISSSPPSVPPKNPLEFFRLQIDNLLKGNDEITKNFYNLLASDEKKVKSDVVADHLVRLDDSNSTEYPLLRLRRLMKKLSDQRLTLDHSYRTVFVSMMDILSVASFPDEDRDRMENAMVEVLRSNPEIGTKIQLSTALPEDVRRLLILTRLKLAAKKFDDFAIDRILNNDYQEGESGSPLFEIVRPVIISEPFILPPDGRSITAYYAEKILESFNSTMPRTDFEGCLTHELKERKGSDGDGEVIALLLSNEASKNAQILQKAFPLLLVIVLERENALRYDTVLLDRNEIEKFLKKILRNPQK